MSGKRKTELAGRSGECSSQATSVLEHQLLEAFEAIPEGIAIFDANDRYVLWNSRYADVYGTLGQHLCVGKAFEEILREGLARGLYHDAIGREREWLQARMLRHRRERNEHEQMLSDGKWVRVQERRSAGGGSVGVRIDITELKCAEESFRLLFEANPVPMWVFDPDTLGIVSVNDAAIALYGYSRERFLTLKVTDLRPEEDRPALLAHLSSGKPTQGRKVWRHLKSGGDLALVTVYSTDLAHNGKNARLCAIVDVTDAKAAEIELRNRKLQLDAAVNNMSQGLLMFDAEQRLVLHNRRYAEMYGVPDALIQSGMTAVDLVKLRATYGSFEGDPEKHCERLFKAMSEGRTHSRTFELPDGRTMHAVSRPMAGGGWVVTHEDFTERRAAQKQIEFLAHHDSLTGLPNRAAFNSHLALKIHEARECGTTIALLSVDVDRFKQINDVFGHAAGDEYLKEIATRLRSSGSGLLARLGGDEFSIILEDATDPVSTAERILTECGKDLEIGARTVRGGVSIGVAVFPTDGQDVPTLLANADAALYRAKRSGRGAVQVFDHSMDRMLRESRVLQNDLRVAVEMGQMALHYQPIIKTTGAPAGFEALLRWNHPRLGDVSPGTFIPLSEEDGSIVSLGHWALREACTEASKWRDNLRISVNLSPIQLKYSSLPQQVRGVLAATGLAPHSLELEVTESALMDNPERALSILKEIKSLGVSIAMDDFGTGYSSLSHLQAFPFDRIKIDRQFISGAGGPSLPILRAVLGLAGGLRLPVTAEGVATAEQLDLVIKEGCEEIQGFLIGRPGPIEVYREILTSGQVSLPHVA